MPPQFTRIDIVKGPEMVSIRKWRAGWSIGQINDEYVEMPADYDPEPSLIWAEAHGWDVRRWPGGARAFAPGTLAPVRHKNEIIRLRNRLEDETYRYHGQHPRGIEVNALDLAYEL